MESELGREPGSEKGSRTAATPESSGSDGPPPATEPGGRGVDDAGVGRAADDLRAVGLSAARVWADYPPTPWWWWPAFAALWAGFVVAATRAVELSNVWLFDAAAVVLAVGELALLYHHRRVRGAWPRLATMPPEIRTLVGRQFVLTAGVAVVVVLLCLAGWSLVAAGLTFAYLALGGGIVYERAYRRAADAAVARVSV